MGRGSLGRVSDGSSDSVPSSSRHGRTRRLAVPPRGHRHRRTRRAGLHGAHPRLRRGRHHGRRPRPRRHLGGGRHHRPLAPGRQRVGDRRVGRVGAPGPAHERAQGRQRRAGRVVGRGLQAPHRRLRPPPARRPGLPDAGLAAARRRRRLAGSCTSCPRCAPAPARSTSTAHDGRARARPWPSAASRWSAPTTPCSPTPRCAPIWATDVAAHTALLRDGDPWPRVARQLLHPLARGAHDPGPRHPARPIEPRPA